MTFTTYVANSGGLLGLCVGFSFISGIELIFWFCCCSRIFKNKVPCQNPCQSYYVIRVIRQPSAIRQPSKSHQAAIKQPLDTESHKTLDSHQTLIRHSNDSHDRVFIVIRTDQGIVTKEYQKRSKNSVSAQVVAILAVVTLIKDCYKI